MAAVSLGGGAANAQEVSAEDAGAPSADTDTTATAPATVAIQEQVPHEVSQLLTGVLSSAPELPQVDSAAFIDDARAELAAVGVQVPRVDKTLTHSIDRAVVDAVPVLKTPEKEPDLPAPATEEERVAVSDPNYRWRDDVAAKVLAGKPAAEHVLHRVPGSQFDAPRIPDESNFAASRGNSLYGPGTPLYIGEETMCTLAVAGTDAEGRNVGITAGHCGEVGEDVFSADSWQVGPSGTVMATNGYYDYAVIEFGSNAELTRSYNGVTVDEVGGGVRQGETVCKQGVATGFDCATTWASNPEVHVTQLCAMNGDSGAPVLVGDRLVGFVSGGSIPVPGAQFLSCRTPLQGPVHAPTTSIDMGAVLADLDTRGGLGAGFTLPEARRVDDNSGR